jgi:aminopeptidase-like protein
MMALVEELFAICHSHEEVPHRLSRLSPMGRTSGSIVRFDLPVGCLMRTPNAEYPEYHSPADNLSLVRPGELGPFAPRAAADRRRDRGDGVYRGRNPRDEPQLGRRGLCATIRGQRAASHNHMSLLWVLNLLDGRHSFLDIAERAGIPFATFSADTEWWWGNSPDVSNGSE